MAFAPVPGRRVPVGREHVQRGGDERALPDVLQPYTQALFAQIVQKSACNRLHDVQQRLARWPLMTRDRIGCDKFPLIQDFMAKIFGTSERR